MKDVLPLPLLSYTRADPTRCKWPAALRGDLAMTGAGNLASETAQLPLDTTWTEGTVGSRAFAVPHCTAGDLLIALSLLVGVMAVAGDPAWPRWRFGQAALWTGQAR